MKLRIIRSGSLRDLEVAIIKNLISRDEYNNQEILGLVNIVRRAEGLEEINGGRISDVRTGKKNYKNIKPSADSVTDGFLSKAKKISALISEAPDPLSQLTIDDLFPEHQGNKGHLNISETDQVECKQTFGGKHWIDNCIKAIAAFANNKGGYIIFGVTDKDWKIVGTDKSKFEQYDKKNLNQKLRSSLSSAIEIETISKDYSKKTVGIMYVSPAKMKPVIFIKNAGGAAEGQIYYRYLAENRLIGPTELQQIIEERIKNLSENILTKHINKILSFGIENSAIMDLSSGVVEGKSGNFVIDESILPKLSFIKEGEFMEKSGQPTLKLIGEIKSSSKSSISNGEDLLKQYPFTWTEVAVKVSKEASSATRKDISDIIRANKLKGNSLYSSYSFPSKKKQDEYLKTGRVAKSTPVIYNQRAIDFIVEKIKANTH